VTKTSRRGKIEQGWSQASQPAEQSIIIIIIIIISRNAAECKLGLYLDYLISP
jgi:hypothetical protein